MKKYILIFDFDGTIADTHRYLVDISNRLAQEFNYNKINLNELDDLKNKSSQEIIHYLKIPVMKIPAIIAKGKKEFHKGIADIRPFYGIKDILLRIKETGTTIGILSSNSLENINKFLQNHDMEFFDFIHATPKLWSKNTSLKKLIKSNGFSIDQILYVGDEIRDISAAKKVGIKVAAVGWGYNSAKALRKYNPDYVLQTPDEIYKLCTNNPI